MRQGSPSFAAFKPAFWRQKNENKNDDTQNIPLPAAAFVVPEKQFLQCCKHLFKAILCQIQQTMGRPGKRRRNILTSRKSCVNEVDLSLQLHHGCGFNYMTVAHLYDPSAHCCSLRIVRDHNDGLIEAVVQLLKHIQNECRAFRIKVSGRFVC